MSFEKNTVIQENIQTLGDLYDTSIGIQESTDRISRKSYETSKRVDIYIGQGIFVLSKDELKRLNFTDEEKKTAIRKYLDPNDVGKYKINFSEKYIIYSDKYVRGLIGANKLPIIKKHLDNLNEFITSSNKPYGLHRSRELKYFNNPKIIFKGMFASNEFALDSNNYFTGFSFSLIIQKDKNYTLKYLLALLNSKFALDWFYKNSKHRGAGVDVGVIKLRTFPIPKATDAQQTEITEIVDEIIEAKKLAPTADTGKLEGKIDKLVYQLYGLTDEEIRIVEGKEN